MGGVESFGHGAFGPVDRLGDLVVSKALLIAEQDDRAKVIVETAERRLNGACQFGSIVTRHGARPPGGDRRRLLNPSTVESTALQGRLSHPQRDPIEPPAIPAGLPQATVRQEHLAKGLLSRVLRILEMPELAFHEVIDSRLIKLDQPAQRLGVIPFLGAPEKVLMHASDSYLGSCALKTVLPP
jgi:hypothetical protein